MAQIITPQRWFKPPIGVGINWGHPLARGLRSAYLLNAGGSISVLTSLAKQDSAAWTPVGTPVPNGEGAQTASGAAAWRCDQTYPTLSVATIMLISRFSGSPAGSSGLYSLASTSNGNPLFSILTGSTAGKIRTLIRNTAGTSSDHDDVSSGINDLKNHVYLLSKTALAAHAFYIDGKTIFTDTTSVDLSATAFNTTAIGMRNNGGTNTGFVNGIYVAAYLWDQAGLTASDAAWLYAEPYAFFIVQSPQKRYFYGTTAAAGGLFRNSRLDGLGGVGRKQFNPGLSI